MKASSRFMTDDRGAVMLIAVFFAVFLVSILYLGIGAGEAVLFREHLQDTADSAALSGAITYARLMNLIVLINLVMAALVAILVALKLVEGLAIVGIAIAAGLAYFTGGGTLIAIPPLNALRSNMAAVYDELKPTIYQFLEVLHDVSGVIINVAPAAVEGVTSAEIERSDAASEGFVMPSSLSLPLEEDSYSKLCEQGGEMVERLAVKPFKGLGPVESIAGIILEPVSSLAGAMSEWFCGEGGTSMPDFSRSTEKGYPAPEDGKECEDTPIEHVERGKEADAHSDPCDKAKAEQDAAKPDDQGYCQTDCDIDGPYERAVALARTECSPTLDPAPSKYRYQLQQMRVWYTWDGKKWVKGTPEIVSSTIIKDDSRPPCGPGNVHPTIAEGYNTTVHPSEAPNSVAVVCSSEGTPELPYPDPDADEKTRKKFKPPPVAYDYQQVPQIFGCMRPARAGAEVSEGAETKEAKNTNGKSPRQVKHGLKLGEESWQLRAVVFGSLEQRESQRLVRLGLWGKDDPDNPLENLRHLGGFSVAQAEYYYAGPGGPDAWMWNMGWRARLRRFDVSEASDDKESSEDSSDPMVTLAKGCLLVSAKPCAKMLLAVELMKDSFVH